MTHRVLHRAPEVRHHILPIDFSGTDIALTNNLSSRRKARALLDQGGALALFPGGGVAAPSATGKAIERPWGRLAAKLAMTSGADVLTVFFHGQNSCLFQTSRIHLALRYGLLFHEVKNKIGTEIVIEIGPVNTNGDLRHPPRRPRDDLSEETDLATRLVVEPTRPSEASGATHRLTPAYAMARIARGSSPSRHSAAIARSHGTVKVGLGAAVPRVPRAVTPCEEDSATMSLNDRFEPIAVRNRDDLAANPTDNESIHEIVERRLSRRALMRGLCITALSTAIPAGVFRAHHAHAAGQGFRFEELSKGLDETHHVAAGYKAQPLIRWGDPVVPGAPEFDPMSQTAAAQELQFGYNCDFTAFLPLPRGSASADRGLLVVNHEYTNPDLMFAGVAGEGMADRITKEQAEIELAAHGLSVLEVRRAASGDWEVVGDSRMNRRITLRSTEFEVRGPAAGHKRLKTSADPSGRKIIGTLNNCGGGVTPWGTVLSAEENFQQYFAGDPSSAPEAANHKRVGIENAPDYAWWGRHFARFDVAKEPNEPNRFGWIVEIDPYNPRSVPVKRTALGRFKHEAATVLLNKDGRVVVYTGDDQRFEYVYRFVSAARFDPSIPMANRDLLDAGTLSVAKFEEDGSLAWLPLVHGEGPLTAANGFASQADVVIEARRAADLLGATPMDRPEDIEANLVTGTVFAVFTNNTKRIAEKLDAANPRPDNKFGHIIEMIPPGGRGRGADHAADRFRWEMFIRCGDPGAPEQQALYPASISTDGWFANPDNVAFDSKGRLWVATDGAAGAAGFSDGLWVIEVEGPHRGLSRHFFRVPTGAEMCGPSFTPDDGALFVAVQHPAEGKEPGESSFDKPLTRWPDFRADLPPRPAIVVITREDGGPIA